MRALRTAAHMLAAFFGIAALTPQRTDATQFSATGQIAFFRSTDSSVGVDKDYFSVEGVSSVSSCGTYQGAVLFILKDDAKGTRQYAFVLSALRSSAPITVYVDDTRRRTAIAMYAPFSS